MGENTSSFTDEEPLFTPTGDGRFWRVERGFTYHVGDFPSLYQVTIPEGFYTDGASIPWAVTFLIKPWGRHWKAAIVHDYLYKNHEMLRQKPDMLFGDPVEPIPVTLSNESMQYVKFDTIKITRRQADDIFKEAMEIIGVTPWKIKIMYRAVRLVSWRYW